MSDVASLLLFAASVLLAMVVLVLDLLHERDPMRDLEAMLALTAATLLSGIIFALSCWGGGS